MRKHANAAGVVVLGSPSPPVLARQTVPSPKQTRTEPVASRAGRRPRGGTATARMEDSNSLGTSRGSLKITHRLYELPSAEVALGCMDLLHQPDRHAVAENFFFSFLF